MTRCVQALMLAAGESHRFGCDKRLYQLESGLPMLVQALRHLQAVVAHVVLVIKPGETPLFSELLVTHKMPTLVEATAADAGMGASLACGIGHVDGDAVLITLADMPFIQSATIAQVATALSEHPLVVPEFRGTPGHPVGFDRRFFGELAALTADEGGRHILHRHRQQVTRLAVRDPGVIKDIDTPLALPR